VSREAQCWASITQIATATLTKNPAITHKGTAKPLITLKTANAAKQALVLDTANKRTIWQRVQSLEGSIIVHSPCRKSGLAFQFG
jgi:hypothetical protein